MSEAGQARKAGKDAPFPFKFDLYPESINFETIYQGPEGPRIAVHAVIQSQKHLDGTLPNAAELGIKPGTIDFRKQQLIIVGLGERPTTGYKAVIEDVTYLTDRNEGPEAGKNLPNSYSRYLHRIGARGKFRRHDHLSGSHHQNAETDRRRSVQ